MEAKTCTKCSETKPLGEFSLRNKSGGRRHTQCKACVREYCRARNRTIRDRALSTDEGRCKTDGGPVEVKRKTCPGCNETKPRARFNRNLTKLDGLASYCKKCQKRKRDALRTKNAESGPATVGDRRCGDCGETKPLDTFGVNLTKADGRTYVCNACAAERSRRYRREDPGRARRAERLRRARRLSVPGSRDAERARRREYYRLNRSRFAQLRDRRQRGLDGRKGTYTERDLDRQWQIQRGCCLYCSARLGRKRRDATYHIEHITPLSRGGVNWPRNIGLACESCNLTKRDMWPAEFRLYLRRRLNEGG